MSTWLYAFRHTEVFEIVLVYEVTNITSILQISTFRLKEVTYQRLLN